MANGQFHRVYLTNPDSTQVSVNGKPDCRTPCTVVYDWKDAVDGRMIFHLSAPGYEDHRDTISKEPYHLYEEEMVAMKRILPHFDLEPGTVHIAFDRILAADFADGTVVGHRVRGKNSEAIKWEGDVKVGDRGFTTAFDTLVHQCGFNQPAKESVELFSDAPRSKPIPPRYLVAAKLVGYSVDWKHAPSPFAEDGPWLGSVRMDLEWQVKDQFTSRVIMTQQHTGISHYRAKDPKKEVQHQWAFEDALLKFLADGELARIVREAAPTRFTRAAKDSLGNASIEITPPGPVTHRSPREMIKFAEKACVTIITEGGHGSGVLLSEEGHVLSAYHVVEGMSHIEVMFAGGVRMEARILSLDVPRDVVLLDIVGSGYKALRIASSDSLSLGDEVFTIGTPADLELGQSVSRGIVSGRRGIGDEVLLQTDMAVSPGNSGGPLLDLNGEVVGVVQSKIVAQGVEGIGFALPIERALEALGVRIGP